MLEGRITLGPNEAAKALGVGRTKIFELMATGNIRRLKLGRRTLIEVDELRRLMSKLAA